MHIYLYVYYLVVRVQGVTAIALSLDGDVLLFPLFFLETCLTHGEKPFSDPTVAQ